MARFLPLMAVSQPEACALKTPDRRGGKLSYRSTSYSDLDKAVDRKCRRFHSRGIRRGMRVLLLVRPGYDLIVVVFALFKIGAVPVVIDPGMGIRNFLRCVRSSRPEGLVAIAAGRVLSRLFFRAFRTVRYRLPAQDKNDGGTDAVFETAQTDPNDPAAILFTSGSTGAAKGVCYEHGMFAAQVEAIREQYGISPGEVDLPMLPIFALFNPALGMTTVVPEMNPSRPAEVDPSRIVEAIQMCGVTNSFGSPVLWDKVGRYCRDHRARLPSLRRILMAGAPVPPSLMAAFRDLVPNAEIHTPYGATESLPVSSISAVEVLGDTKERTERGEGTCVGQIFPEMEVRILPIEDGEIEKMDDVEALAVGEVGEIVVRGPVVTLSYDGLEEETRRAKILSDKGIWHRMGDAGYFDDQGRLWFCGRVVERVETKEGTLYTACCEGIFNRVSGVFRTALIGLDRDGVKVPALVVEPEPERFPRSSRDKEDFIRLLRVHGGGYGCTRSIETFFFCRKFPVDVRHNAKIHRLALARRFNRDR